MSKKIILLGCYCGDGNYELIHQFFKKNITVSNSEYEKTLFNGFLENNFDIQMISAPSVGKFPSTCKKLRVSGFRPQENITIVKYFAFGPILFSSKYHAMKKALKNLEIKSGDDVVVIASEPHFPYLKLLKYAQRKFGYRTSLIVPDLPENIKGSASRFYSFLKKKLTDKIYKYSNNYVDSFLFFTNAMKDKFDLLNKRYIVREGVIEKFNFSSNSNAPKICTYIGKTNEKNGIDLIIKLAKDRSDVSFDIYGNGDEDKKLASLNIPNLHYHGFLNPNDIEEKLINSDILVSPRYLRDYTNYSFPSKILKYISVGKPIVTFNLPCYPPSFGKILFYPQSQNYNDLLQTFETALNYDNNKLHAEIIEHANYLLAKNVSIDYYSILF